MVLNSIDFDNIEIASAGDRDPDSDSVEVCLHQNREKQQQRNDFQCISKGVRHQ